MAQYPMKSGYYNKNELFYLSLSLGFPGHMLTKGLEDAPSSYLRSEHQRLSMGQPLSEKSIRDLLEEKHMLVRLEKLFNNYPAEYNRELFSKAMSLLKQRKLTFSEISECRVSFELYSNKDGAGMNANVSTVLQALKMLERVISPLELKSEIQLQQKFADFHTRIQMYEFMDLVVKCVPSKDIEKEIEFPAEVRNQDSNFLPLALPDFNQLLMTKDELIFTYLDQQYKKSLYREVKPSPAASRTQQMVSSSWRQASRVTAHRQVRALTPSLQYSQHQLFCARKGSLVFTKEQYQKIESSRQSSRERVRSKSAPALTVECEHADKVEVAKGMRIQCSKH